MDAKWLNDQFDRNPAKTKGDLSAILGIQPSGISKMLAGTRQIKAKEYMLMRNFFGMAGTGQAIEPRKKNISSYINLNAEDYAKQEWSGPAPLAYNVIEVSDSAMLPDFLPGERVLIDNSTSLNDKPGIFAIEEQGRILIRIAEHSGISKIKLSAIAKDSEPLITSSSRVKILGRVIAKLNWL